MQPIIYATEAITALGDSQAMSSCAIAAGLSAFENHPFMLDMAGAPYKVAMVPLLEPGETQRIPSLVEKILNTILVKLPTVTESVDLLINLPAPRPGLPPTIAQDVLNVAQAAVASHQNVQIFIAEQGRMGGALAVQSVQKRLAEGVEFVVVLAADSYFDATTLSWLDLTGQLLTQVNAWGMVPGEAAAATVFCSPETASTEKQPSAVKLVAVGIANEPGFAHTPPVCTGEGLTSALDSVLAELPADATIDDALSDTNGQLVRTDELGFMFTRRSQYFSEPGKMNTPVDACGDVGAASIPLLINLACELNTAVNVVLASSGGVHEGQKEPAKRAVILLEVATHGA